MSKIRGPQIDTGADGIQTANLEDLAVTTAKIDALAVTTAKIGANQVTDAKVDSTVIIASGGNDFSGNQSMGGFKLTGVGAGTTGTDAVNKAQLDSVSAGLDPKASCRVATDAALPAYTASGSGVGKTLTANVAAILTVDGVNVALNDRVLVKSEGAGTDVDNGIYLCTTEGTGGVQAVLTRATDFDEDNEVTAAAFSFIEEGSVNADTGWLLSTDDPITVDTTALTFTQYTGGGTVIAGSGMTKSGSTLDVIGGLGITANANDIEVDYETVGNISAVDAGDAAAAGTNNTAARGDHQHAVSTAAAGAAQVGQGSAEGSATTLARADHTHAHTRGTPTGLGTANAAGTATDFAGADHVHARDAYNQEQVTAENITNSDTAITDTLNATPINDASVVLDLNGIRQVQGATKDYTLSGATITWLASTGTAVNMKTTDTLTATYVS